MVTDSAPPQSVPYARSGSLTAILWLVFSLDGRELAAVFVGGALGTLARAALATLAAPDPGRWPWPTFIVNIVGAFLLGYFTTRLLERLPRVELSAPAAGHRAVRRPDDVLHHAGRDAQDARAPPLRPGRRLHRRQHRRGPARGLPRHRPGAAGHGCADDRRGLGGRHADRRRRRGGRASWSTARWPSGSARPFPFGTLAVNLSGAVLLGFFAGLALSPHAALLAGTAFVGSYTTFSTWMLETQRLGEERQVWPAVANIAVSVVLGVAAAWLGQSIAGRAVTELPEAHRLLRRTAAARRPVPLRRDARPLADSAVATSVVLRGIASFGPHHDLRSDQSLSLSEDPPIAIAAVDTADKMAGLADQVAAMMPRGLVTLERAHARRRVRRGRPDAAKLTVYVGRQDRADGRPAYRAVCDVLHRLGFAGASVFLGVDGTAHGAAQTGRLLQPQHRCAGDDHRGRHRRAGRRRAARTRNAAARAAFSRSSGRSCANATATCSPDRPPCPPPTTTGARCGRS